MKKRAIKLILLCLVSVFQLLNVYSQQNDYSDWQPKISQFENFNRSFYVVLSSEDRKKMEIRWNEIGEDLKTEKNNVAGTYIESGYEAGYLLR